MRHWMLGSPRNKWFVTNRYRKIQALEVKPLPIFTPYWLSVASHTVFHNRGKSQTRVISQSRGPFPLDMKRMFSRLTIGPGLNPFGKHASVNSIVVSRFHHSWCGTCKLQLAVDRAFQCQFICLRKYGKASLNNRLARIQLPAAFG